MSLTLSYDPALSRVRVAVTGLLVDPDETAQIQRSVNEVVWTVVRGAAGLDMGTGDVGIDDYEFAPDVPNYYRAVASVPLNLNPFLETNAADWTTSDGTGVRSTAQAHQGVASLLLTPSGAGTDPRVETTTRPTVTAGSEYTAKAWVRCAASRNVQIGIVWYDAINAYLDDDITTHAVTATTWTQIEVTATAPVGAIRALLLIRMTGTPPGTHLLYIDQAYLLGPPASVFDDSITPTIDGVWIKSIARPFLNRQVDIRDQGDITRPSRAGVFEVVGRSFPVVVNDVRGSRRWALELRTETPDEAKAVDLIFASGDPLFIQVPTSGPFSVVRGGYVSVGPTTQRWLAPFDPVRIFELPLTEIAPPGPDVVGATVTCAGIVASFATCAHLVAAFDTCADVLDYVFDPDVVIVP